MLAGIFTEATTTLTAFVTFLGDAFENAIKLIYDGTAITAMGTLIILTIVSPLVIALLNWGITQLKAIKFKAAAKK